MARLSEARRAATAAFTWLHGHPSDLDGPGDLPPVLHELRRRHTQGQPYTWLSHRVMLSVNPARPLLQAYADGARTAMAHAEASRATDDELLESRGAEHLFRLAEAAGRQAEAGRLATVACAGESGSGKTEAAKLVLLHLLQRGAALSRAPGGAYASPHTSREERVHRALSVALLLARAVVEAFSHAGGGANPNASRLILHTVVRLRLAHESGAGLLLEAKLRAALLQLHRAATPPSGRRANFHLLVAAAASATPGELAGLSPHELRLIRTAGPTHGAGLSFETLSAALQALGMERSLIKQIRRLLLGLLLLGQLDLRSPLLLRLVQTGSTPAAAGATLLAQCEALLECDRLSERILSRPTPAGGMEWRSAEESEEARDAVVALAYGALFDTVLQWLNSVLAEAASSAGSKAESASSAAGSVVIVDCPGVEGIDEAEAHASLDALCHNFVAESVRLRALELMLPAPPDDLLEDDALNAIFARGQEGVVGGVLVAELEGAFALLHEAIGGDLLESDTSVGAARVGAQGRAASGPLQEKLQELLLPSHTESFIKARTGAEAAVFLVDHHSHEVKYSCASWTRDASRRSSRYHREPLLAAIKQHPAIEKLLGKLISSRGGAQDPGCFPHHAASPAPLDEAATARLPLAVPIGDEPAAVHSSLGVLSPRNSSWVVLCIRPNRAPSRSSEWRAARWDGEAVASQLHAYRVLDTVLHAAAPPVEVSLPYEALEPVRPHLEPELAALPISQLMLLLACACGVEPASISLGDHAAALPNQAGADHAAHVLRDTARGIELPQLAERLERAARGEHPRLEPRPPLGRKSEVGCRRQYTTPRNARRPAAPPAKASEADESRWGAALRRLRAHDEGLAGLRLSLVTPGHPPLRLQRLASAGRSQSVMRAQLLHALCAAKCPLKVVELCGVGLGDEAAPMLQRLLRRHPYLRVLDLRHNLMTAPVMLMLARAASSLAVSPRAPCPVVARLSQALKSLRRVAAEVRSQRTGAAAPLPLRLKTWPMLSPVGETARSMSPTWSLLRPCRKLPPCCIMLPAFFTRNHTVNVLVVVLPFSRLLFGIALLVVIMNIITDSTRYAAVNTSSCDNTCSTPGAIRNGICEDGGFNSSPQVICPIGTDCFDCGLRAEYERMIDSRTPVPSPHLPPPHEPTSVGLPHLLKLDPSMADATSPSARLPPDVLLQPAMVSAQRQVALVVRGNASLSNTSVIKLVERGNRGCTGAAVLSRDYGGPLRDGLRGELLLDVHLPQGQFVPCVALASSSVDDSRFSRADALVTAFAAPYAPPPLSPLPTIPAPTAFPLWPPTGLAAITPHRHPPARPPARPPALPPARPPALPPLPTRPRPSSPHSAPPESPPITPHPCPKPPLHPAPEAPQSPLPSTRTITTMHAFNDSRPPPPTRPHPIAEAPPQAPPPRPSPTPPKPPLHPSSSPPSSPLPSMASLPPPPPPIPPPSPPTSPPMHSSPNPPPTPHHPSPNPPPTPHHPSPNPPPTPHHPSPNPPPTPHHPSPGPPPAPLLYIFTNLLALPPLLDRRQPELIRPPQAPPQPVPIPNCPPAPPHFRPPLPPETPSTAWTRALGGTMVANTVGFASLAGFFFTSVWWRVAIYAEIGGNY